MKQNYAFRVYWYSISYVDGMNNNNKEVFVRSKSRSISKHAKWIENVTCSVRELALLEPNWYSKGSNKWVLVHFSGKHIRSE